MRSFYTKDGTIYIRHEDYSGNAIVEIHQSSVRYLENLARYEVAIPIDLILGFAAQYVREQRIARIERASDAEILDALDGDAF